MFGFRLIRWVPIEKYNKDHAPTSVLLKDYRGGVFEGWLSDDGWHYSSASDHMDFPCEPQPSHFAFLPRT